MLILHTGEAPEEVGPLAERLLYPLWDSGLTVGHAVRTHLDCVSVAADRLDARTAMLDGRALAGDEGLWESVHADLLGSVRADPRAFAESLRNAARERRERHGAVSFLLEPELKEGAGGLRDVHTLGWLALVEDRAPSFDGAGTLRASERVALADAHEFLVRVRSALHLQTGRASDRLFLEQQPQLALDLGFLDEPGLPAVDALMRAVFEHARQVEHIRDAALDRFLHGGTDDPDAEATPAGILRSLARLAGRGAVASAEALDRMEAVEVADPVEWDDPIRDAFLELLRLGSRGTEALETLDRLGRLTSFVPAWTAVRCRPQRDPYHRYSVDVHLLRTLSGMGRLLEGDEELADPLAVQAGALVDERDGLLLGALLHDIGKTGRGHHVDLGVHLAEEALSRMRLPAPTRDLARFMVAEHLLLPDTATRRDLEDDDLIHDVAVRVGRPDRLAALYLLAVADAHATGPLAWTPWRAALVRELVAKVQRVLERGEVGADTGARLAERADEIRAALSGEDPAEVDRFLVRMPRAYYLSLPAERIAEHFSLTRPPVGAIEVRTLTGPGARAGSHGLTVVAADRPGLLSMIAGSLALVGLSILSAQAYTTEDGAAVDVFDVEGVFEADVGEERWRELRSTLRRAIEGRLSLPYRVQEKRERYPAPRGDAPVRVSVDNGSSDFFTVIEVGASDRIGLLFDITRTFADLQLDVHLAKVATYGERVIDAFYVRDQLGRKLEDAEHIEELERALRARIGPDAD